MKVVLVRLPFYALFGVTTPKMKTYPLNLISLATFLRKQSSHDAVIVDGETVSVPGLHMPDSAAEDPEIIMNQGIPRMIELLEDAEHPLWAETERLILDASPDLIGITCNSGNMDAARVLIGRLKRHGLPIILGGSHPTVLPEQSLNYTGADMVAVGEGELTLRSLMNHLQQGEDLSKILSLGWKQNGHVEVNPKRDLIPDIDKLPLPDRSLIDRASYFGEVVMTGRGCPFDCAYCASRNIWGRRVRLRSVESVIAELEELREDAATSDLGVETTGSRDLSAERPGRWVVKILDDTFTVNRKRTLQLLDQIVNRGLNRFEFTGGVRADTLDEVVVSKMAAANFRRVTLGVESGSRRILKMIRKGETNENVRNAIGLLRNAGIHSHAFFMIGLPGETVKDIELTKKLIMEVRPDHVEINMVTPYPGTDIFEELILEDPSKIDRWYRWFHQGMATHSERLGYDLDKAYMDFLEFAKEYHGVSQQDE
jgi:anaerobic magnesium-protoporphyrin IX monomethyl ester cyclase